ncbi:glycerophosphodiester phosphodiesterase [Paenibacillus sp. 1001270B_150601_E10]|uniref:glycerophosphodiester phosphodiesterase n=1 Tax=Paenibacillus sp. 1001270B_150601_E10 TaxID=2787079 RepID=UPI00189E0D30|nr:glycerophosphodiester phosphodiesterase [Paenibacillus sp. 1001270B_150601_E10]
MRKLNQWRKLFRFKFTREMIALWKHALQPFLIFELVYKLLTIVVFLPVLSVLFNKILDWGDFNAIANFDLLRFVFSRYGLISIVVMAPIAFLLIYTEFAVLIYIAYYGALGKTARIRAVLQQVLIRLPRVWRFGTLGTILYLLLLFPLLDVGFGASLLPGIQIPNFITGELMKTGSGIALLSAVGFVIFILNLVSIYALPILVLEKSERFWPAMKKSARLFWRSKWSLIKVMIEWFLLTVIAGLIIVGMIFGIVLFFAYESLSEVWTGFLLSTLVSVGLYGLSLLFTPLFISFITCLYRRYSDPNDIDPSLRKLDRHSSLRGARTQLFVKRNRSKLVTFLLAVLIAISWGITTVWNTIGEPPDDFVIMAHRGDIRSGVENTMEAFEGAIRAEADLIELDLLQTKDGKLAVIHDTNLKRLAGRNVNVYDLTLEELQKIPLSENGFIGHVPSFEEVLQVLQGRIKLNVELKIHGQEDSNYVKTFVDTVRRYQAEQDIIVQSVEYDIVQDVKDMAPDLKVGYVIFATLSPKLHSFRADFFVIEESFVNAGRIASAKLAGRPLYVWTVNSTDAVQHFYTLGVDGIITDITSDARQVINELMEPILKVGF